MITRIIDNCTGELLSENKREHKKIITRYKSDNYHNLISTLIMSVVKTEYDKELNITNVYVEFK